MNRITLKQLNNLAELLTNLTNENFEISQAYGGYKLVKVLDKGGERDISRGYISKRDLYYQIHMYIDGFNVGMKKQ